MRPTEGKKEQRYPAVSAVSTVAPMLPVFYKTGEEKSTVNRNKNELIRVEKFIESALSIILRRDFSAGKTVYKVVNSLEMIFHSPSVLIRWKKSTKVAEPRKPVSETTTAATLPSMRMDSISA